ncbi:MAG: rhodanese-like domain-containing protein [Spirulina sp. SIO3F2]|nr:rhodanese-like domain-containing protein [Spirulina sp. SIO3F2]
MFTVPHRQHHWLLAVFLCTSTVACAVNSVAQIAPETLAAQIQTQTAPLVLDVRTPQEYAAGHIPGAINIEFRELEARLAELPIAPDEAIVVYCEQGVRAGVAERTLAASGFTAVLHLQGDMVVWRQQKLPIARGEATP